MIDGADASVDGDLISVDYDPFADAPLARVLASTESQQEIWLACRLSSDASLAYNESVTLRLRGTLDRRAMTSALHSLVERHESLRATFGADGTTMLVASEPSIALAEIDLSELTSQAQATALERLLSEQVGNEFDLTNGPLIRVQLVCLGKQHHVVVLTAHHIVCDGWSFGVIVQDLGRLYRRECGESFELEPAVPFSKYALERAAHDRTPSGVGDADYWTQLFRDLPSPLDLPTDRPRRARRTFTSRRVDTLLDASLVNRLREFGARHGGSLHSVLLAGFGTMLLRVAGNDDLVIGVPSAGQSDPGFEEVVGHCVNLLPVRLKADAALMFGELASAAQGAMLDALDHRNYTLGTLLKRLILPRDPARPALVSVMFNLDRAVDTADSGFPGLTLDWHGNPRSRETFELFVNAVQEPGGLRLECQFNSDLFDDATVLRWMAGYEALLLGACEQPGHTLGSLPFVGASDRALLDKWNDTPVTFPRGALVHELIEARTNRVPDNVALISGDKVLSYADLDAHARRIQSALMERGVGPGSLVGLCVTRGPGMLAGMLGVLKAGAAYVPLDPSYPAQRVTGMAADAHLALVISEPTLADEFGWTKEYCLLLDALGEPIESPPSAAGIAADAAPRTAAMHSELPAYVIYTSGSTGKPKGVMVPHRSVVNFLDSMAREPGITADDTVVAVTTLSFDIAVTELLLPLTVGARVVLASREEVSDAQLLRLLIERHEVSVMQATPGSWRMLLDAGWSGAPGFKALCGGEPLDLPLARRLRARTASLWNMYGPTETTVWSTVARVSPDATSIDIGRPIANTSVWILDDRLQPCAIGVAGEIVIGGEGVSLGYLDRPELTAERFVPNMFSGVPGARLYRTGDRGRWRNDGVLEHLGRSDFQVKVRGYRIELGEIEAALLAATSVAGCVVTTREDREGDVRLVAYVVPRDSDGVGGSLDELALRATLRLTLPEYMLPQHYVSMKGIPLLPNGKVDRRSLPAPVLSHDAPEGFVAPGTDLERTIASAMETALSLPGLGAHDNFFTLGGHSLLASQVAAALGATLGRRVPIAAIFDAPTVAELATWIETSDQGALDAGPAIEHNPDIHQAPASLMQQRLSFLDQLNPGAVTYHLPSAHRLTGPMDVDALERSINLIVERQSALRTEMDDQNGIIVQRIVPQLTVSLQPAIDLSAVEAHSLEAHLLALLQARALEHIDVKTAPLFRVGLYRLSEEEHVLFFMPHHIIWDGWSFDLFYAEMASLYDACTRGRPPALPTASVSYGDFARWQARWLQSAEARRQLLLWESLLADLPEPLELPNDKARPARMSGSGATHSLSWPLELTERARVFGASHGTTLFTTLLTAYALLLHRVSGQRDIVIGTPVRGRHLAEVESVMGFFVNTLPLRVRIDPAQSFESLLKHVHTVVVAAFSAPDVPMERLVQALNIPRDESRPLIYQAFFSFQDARAREHSWGALTQQQVHVFQSGSADDLGLWFLESPRGLTGGLTYNTDILTSATAKGMIERLECLTESVLEDPKRPVGEGAYAPASERRLIASWNDTFDTSPIGAHSVGEMLKQRMLRTPDRVALRSAEGIFTYRELDEKSDRLARRLRGRGVGRGALVGILLERSLEMVVAQLAVFKSGAAYVPLDPGYPRQRLTDMAEDAQLRLTIATSALVEQLDWPPTATLLLDADAPESAPASATGLESEALASDPAYVIFTSGSTGKPKGVVVSHGALLNFLVSMAREPGLEESDRLVAVTTLSFDIAALELFLPLVVGAEIVLASRDVAHDAADLRELIESSKATVMQATPATWRMLVEAGWAGSKTFKALVGGEPLPTELAKSLLERCGSLWNMYGPTETTVWSTCWRVTEAEGSIPIGRPIRNTRVEILDSFGEPCAIGVHGEICIGGDGLATGYLNRPELTAERFVTQGSIPGVRFYRTGDRGRWSPGGYLEHLGRLDAQVKVRGHRVELGEIEFNLVAYGGVSQAVAIVREDLPGDVRLVAYVVTRSGDLTAGDLRGRLRKVLPEYMIPQHIVILSELPLTLNGKVDRKQLPRPVDSAGIPSVEKVRAPSTTEQRVAEIWKEILGVATVDPSDNFFDLGGHSLLAMRVVSQLQSRLGMKVPVRRLIFESLAQISATPASAVGEVSRATEARSGGLLTRVLARLGRGA